MASLSSSMLRGLVKNKMERVRKGILEAKTLTDKVKAYRQGMAIPLGSVVLGKYDIVDSTLAKRPVTWISRDLFPADKVILYLHGGGYIGGSILYSRNSAASLAESAGCRLVSLDYRLAPENVWPAALDDALAAYRQLLEDHVPASGIVIAGESAGGGLALACTLAVKQQGLPLPAAVVALSPWCDLALSSITIKANRERDIMLSPEFLEVASSMYCADHDRTDPLISPMYGDFHGFPPLLLQVAAEELLLGEIIQTAEKASSQSDNEVNLEIFEGVWHVWQTMDEIVPEAKQAVENIGRFIKKHQQTDQKASAEKADATVK